MHFSQANIASIMMLISEKKLSVKESTALLEVVNARCDDLTQDISFGSKVNEKLARHFLSKWLISNNSNISEEDLKHFSSQLKRSESSPYKELSFCSLAGSLTLVNRFLMSMYASGSISESEMTELSGEYSVSLKQIYFDVIDEYLKTASEESTKILILHMIERSLSQNLSQYFKTVLEQGLIEQFLSNPLSMLKPLRTQVKKEIDLAINLAEKVI